MSSKYRDDIIRLRKQDKTYREIEDTLGCSRSTISYHCNQVGLQGEKNEKISEEKAESIKAYYKNHTARETAEKFNVSEKTVQKYGEKKKKQVTKNSKEPDSPYVDSKKYRGELTEEKVAVKFMEKGYTVLDPRGREKYDLVVHKDGEFDKVQCKHLNFKENYGIIKTNWQGRKKAYTYSSENVDYFATWCKEKDEVYLIPFEEAGRSSFRLRFEDTKNSQNKRVNYAENYKL